MKERLKRLWTYGFGSVALVVTGLSLFGAYMLCFRRFEGGNVEEETMLERHPGVVVVGVVLYLLVLASLEMWMPFTRKWRLWIGHLLALLIPVAGIVLLIVFYAQLFPEPERDVVAIQAERFGDDGTFLKNADRIVLYSLEPNGYIAEEGVETPKLFHKYEVYGKIKIDDVGTIGAISNEMYARIYSGLGASVAYCFDPRHGMRAYQEERFKDYLICFECAHLYVYEQADGGHERIGLEGDAIGLLNKLLDDAGVKRDLPYRG